MDNIREAVERARAHRASANPQIIESSGPPKRSPAMRQNTAFSQDKEIGFSSSYLQARRIVAYDGADQRSRPYDMLRTQVLQSMGVNGWKVLGVTSPTPGCGKTLTAINLAFSVVRQPDQSLVLVDMDLRKPRIAGVFGLRAAGGGVLDLLNEQTTWHKAIATICAGEQRLAVLPTNATTESSELLGSAAARTLLQDLRKNFQTVILDLPPILSSDDVIAVLPQIDCILLVAAVGQSKVAEVEDAMRHLRSSQIVRFVLNKATDKSYNYYY